MPQRAGLSDVYTGGYAELRTRARADDPAARAEVAKQLEAYFVQQLLKRMRETSFGDTFFDSHAADLYHEVFEQQISLQMAERGDLGFADFISTGIQGYRARASTASLGRVSNSPPNARVTAPSAQPEPAVSTATTSPDQPPALPRQFTAERLKAAAAAALGPHTDTRVDSVPSPSGAATLYESPQDFVRAVLPHARKAAHALGTTPDVLVAQAALETGWGQHVLPAAKGVSSHNLFGIKADARWDGPQAFRRTLEYDDGVMKRVQAPFRVYRDVGHSFEDYVAFIQSNPRYRAALRSADGPRYASELQSAGYATDPRYAKKIIALMKQEPIRLAAAVSEPKLGSSNMNAQRAR